MTLQVVSLIAAAMLVTSAWGAFPMLKPPGFGPVGGIGGVGGVGGVGGMLARGNYDDDDDDHKPTILTCINGLPNDDAQIRLTFTKMGRSRQGMLGGQPGQNPMGMGFGPMGDDDYDDDDDEYDWNVSGMMTMSTIDPKRGNYRVGIFSRGRTDDKCSPAALGRLVSKSSRSTLGGVGGMGSMSYMGNPFMGNPFFGGARQSRLEPTGLLTNNAILSPAGSSMYSSILRRMSVKDLVGRSVGVCQTLHGALCYGRTAYCCAIVRDHLPASHMYVDKLHPQQQQPPLNFMQGAGTINQGVLPGTVGGVPGVPGATANIMINNGANAALNQASALAAASAAQGFK